MNIPFWEINLPALCVLAVRAWVAELFYVPSLGFAADSAFNLVLAWWKKSFKSSNCVFLGRENKLLNQISITFHS